MSEFLLRFVIKFVDILSQLLYWAILISVLLSWFARGRTPLGAWLDQIVRPLYKPFRWARIGMIDFSPILALLAIEFIGRYLTEFLVSLLP